MTSAPGADRHRPVPPRWGWLVVVAGVALAVVGGVMEYSGKPVAGDPAIHGSPSQSVSRPSESPHSRAPAERASKVPVVKPATVPGRPQRITVPELGMSARVVGIRSDGGALNPPSNPREVGWWSEGAKPGAKKGSAVMTGHTVHTGGGAFDHLEDLSAGDSVIVLTDKGNLRYEVDWVRIYRKQSLAKHAAEVFDQSVPGRLVLITCDDWNGSVYLSNAVVVAHRAD
ncbi:MAG TPA: class F sortase [Kribbellaceae bacterium]